MARTAAQIKAEIRKLQKELDSMGVKAEQEKLEDFHAFCTEHFGRRLVVGDRLERRMYVIASRTDIMKPIMKNAKIEIIKPKSNDREAHDDVCRIGYGYPTIDVRLITRSYIPVCNREVTRTELRKWRLV